MTVSYTGSGVYTGISTDTKPTTGVATNAVFYETDRGRMYTYNGTSWVLGSNAVYNNQANTYNNFNQQFVANTLQLTGSGFAASITPAALGSNITLTLPNSTQTIPGLTDTNSFQNKTITIDQNTLKHSTTNAQGDLLKYDTTSTKYIRIPIGTGNQVLTVNSGATDLAWTTLATANLPATIVYNNQTNTFGAFDQVFPSGNLKLRNTNNAIFTVGALGADITLSLPITTQTIPGLTDTNTFQNKTISSDLNTINNSITNLAGDLLKNTGTKFDRFAKGTANQLLTTNSGATDLVWASLSSFIVKGTFTGNGGSTTVTIAHSASFTPTVAAVTPTSSDAVGSFTTAVNATNIVLTYNFAPPSGTNNLSYMFVVY